MYTDFQALQALTALLVLAIMLRLTFKTRVSPSFVSKIANGIEKSMIQWEKAFGLQSKGLEFEYYLSGYQFWTLEKSLTLTPGFLISKVVPKINAGFLT